MPQSKEQRRQSGRKRVEIWLPDDTVERLDAICEDSGYTRGEQVAAMIDQDYEDWQETILPRVICSPR